MRDLLQRLALDDDGQDVIEYALLTVGIGLAGIAVWPAIAAAVGDAYELIDGNTQNLWETPPPSTP